jgi:glutamine synthetase
MPLLDRVVRLAGQPALAWVPCRVLTADGEPWPYDPRGALEAQLARAAAAGLEIRAGYEIEFFVGQDAEEPRPAHHGPAYSPHALLAIDELIAQLLTDLPANGLAIGQLHAEYGLSQVEVSLAPSDPLRAADEQLLARQTIHAAARAHGSRASFAPLTTVAGVGQGWHLHSSVLRDGRNLLASASASASAGTGASGGATSGTGATGGATAAQTVPVPQGEGASYIAGLLRELPALTAITAPSVPSLTRLRPGYFAGAYTFWGMENREATLRYVPDTPFLGEAHANIELKASDASSNPYLALAALIAAGLSGIEDGLTLTEPIQEDPGTWSEQQREQRGVVRLPDTPAAQEQALLGSDRLRAALGEPRVQAFLAARRSDAAWAEQRTLEEIVAAHLWRY